jgi:hypothetical protein
VRKLLRKFTTEVTENTEEKTERKTIFEKIGTSLPPSVNSVRSVVNDPNSFSGRTKKAHAFARVEDVALCPSQDFGLAVIHGTSQANPI